MLKGAAKCPVSPTSSVPGTGGESVIDPAGLDLDFRLLMKTLLSLRVRNYEEACWGYNFPWQSRAFYAPLGMPDVVCTTMAANAYLDWNERSRDERVLEVDASSERFLLDMS